MRFFKKFAEITLFSSLFCFFVLAGASVAAAQEGGQYFVVQEPSKPSLSAESRAFLESLTWTLFELENDSYYGLSPEARGELFTALRDALNKELAGIDTHTTLIPPSSAKEFAERLQGEYVGIGIAIAVHPDDNKTAKENLEAFVKKIREKYRGKQADARPPSPNLPTAEESGEYDALEKAASIIGAHGIAIKKVFRGSPAEKAGVKESSTIHSVDGVTVIGMSLRDVSNLIKGKEGTPVTLGVADGNAELSEVIVIRGKVDVPLVESASHKVFGKDRATSTTVGYVRIEAFIGMAAEQFSEELTKLVKGGAEKLIIDVRGNGGGMIGVVRDILAPLMPPGASIMSMEMKNGVSEGAVSTPNNVPRIFTGDIVVLMDGGSASGSEILAGALHDHGLATLIGGTTYGKGSIQRTIPLSDDSILKITVSLYKLPSGKLIDKVGIEPDIRAEDDPKTPEDEVLQTALDFLGNR